MNMPQQSFLQYLLKKQRNITGIWLGYQKAFDLLLTSNKNVTVKYWKSELLLTRQGNNANKLYATDDK